MFRVRLSMFIDFLKVALFAPLRIGNMIWLWLQGYRYTDEIDARVRSAILGYSRFTFTTALERNVLLKTGDIVPGHEHDLRLIWEEVRGNISQEDSELIAYANLFRGPDYVDELVVVSMDSLIKRDICD